MILKDNEINMNLRTPKENYSFEPVSDQNVEKLSTEEWLKWREHGPHYNDPTHPEYVKWAFGGSSQAAINNCIDSYETALEFYHKKLGIKPKIKELKNIIPLELGHIYEHSIGEKFKLWMKIYHPEIGINLYYFKKMLRSTKKDKHGNPAFPYCLMDLDGLLEVTNKEGQKALIIYEAKTIGRDNISKINMVKRGICPEGYKHQISYYMMGTNLMGAVIVFSWGQGLDEMAAIWVERDYELEARIIKNNEAMVHCLDTKTEPDVTKMPSFALTKYYARFLDESDPGTIVTFGKEYRDNMLKIKEAYDRIEMTKKKLEEEKKQMAGLFAIFAPLFGEYEKGVFELDSTDVDDGKTIMEITLKRSKYADKPNIEKLKAEKPEIYEKYKQEKFDFTAFKKNESDIAKDYTIVGGINPNPESNALPHFDVNRKKKYVPKKRHEGV